MAALAEKKRPSERQWLWLWLQERRRERGADSMAIDSLLDGLLEFYQPIPGVQRLVSWNETNAAVTGFSAPAATAVTDGSGTYSAGTYYFFYVPYKVIGGAKACAGPDGGCGRCSGDRGAGQRGVAGRADGDRRECGWRVSAALRRGHKCVFVSGCGPRVRFL